jgi:hypothetical protein
LKNNVISRRGREKYTHFEIGGHVQMTKSDPETQRKSLLSDLHMVGKMRLDLLILNLEIPNALQRTREFTLLLYHTL